MHAVLACGWKGDSMIARNRAGYCAVYGSVAHLLPIDAIRVTCARGGYCNLVWGTSSGIVSFPGGDKRLTKALNSEENENHKADDVFHEKAALLAWVGNL